MAVYKWRATVGTQFSAKSQAPGLVLDLTPEGALYELGESETEGGVMPSSGLQAPGINRDPIGQPAKRIQSGSGKSEGI